MSNDFLDPLLMQEWVNQSLPRSKERKTMSEEILMKKPLTGLFRDQPETPEGKYLVKRRDGTVVEWPHFVLGARDPHAAVALRAYADSIEKDPQANPLFVKRLREWADYWDQYRKEHGEGDPVMGRHRKDDPATIEEMRKGWSA